ncbi:MAG TPA: F0F1 ATP synthase subunit delta [Pseudogracilibacillus sp.]|nr:F0F1 ATP synthase subunit delta [Pseudogracilibacillus sp.]
MITVVAKRYAEALFQLAQEKEIADQLISELGTVKEVFEDNEEFVEFLSHPRIPLEKKKEMIDEAFKSFDRTVLNTLKMLAERHRLTEVAAIVDHYVYLYNEARGIATATVYSVRPLTDDEKASLENSFKKKLNMDSITFTNKIDESLLGGVKIQIGNTIYDGSISGKLNTLKNRLTSANL